MEVNNTSSVQNSTLVTNGLNGVTQKTEDTSNFKDAVKIDIADVTAKKADRALSDETQQFLANNKVDLAQDSSTFDKQSVLAHAGSYTAAQGHATAVQTRALLV